MKTNSLYCVLTSIQEPTPSVVALAKMIRDYHGQLIIIGDRKSPDTYPLEDVFFYTIEEQKRLGLCLGEKIPENHYARKNIGYLIAMQNGASCIYETDDDNAPSEIWKPRHLRNRAITSPNRKWVNVYKYFLDNHIWPRGFPLQFTQPDIPDAAFEASLGSDRNAPIQQGLVNGSPDVDAIWRLLYNNNQISFKTCEDIWLPKNSWCPFNSQNTWWWAPAYSLMYLPSYCSFRMTDIWRSFIAQRCIWDEGYGVLYFSPDVIQERNYHNLKKDFEFEIPGYLRNEELCGVLNEIDLSSEKMMSDKLLHCYEVLIKNDFFPLEELTLVHAWIEDIEKIQTRLTSHSRP